MKLYQRIAQAMDAHARVNDPKTQFTGDRCWLTRHRAAADELCKRFLPHGSGFDVGVKIDWTHANHPGDRFVLIVDYHNTDEHGGYDGWGTYIVSITASLTYVFDLKITGGQRKYREMDKEHIGDVISDDLNEEITDAQWKEVLESV